MQVGYEMLLTAVYTVVDDWYQAVGIRLVEERPGPKPDFTDSEVLALELARQLEGQTSERRWHETVQANWLELFPRLPGVSCTREPRVSIACWTDSGVGCETSCSPMTHDA